MSKKTHFLRKFLKFWGPPILWAMVIFTLSSKPTGTASQIDWQDFFFKKTAHIIEYGTLTTLLYRALVNSGVKIQKAAIYAVAMAFLYGFSDEFHQSFTPGRMPRFYDVIFDTIGASLAIYTIWILLPKAPKKLRNLAKFFQLI